MVEYYLAMKRSGVLINATAGMDFQNIMLSEVIQTQKYK